MSDRTKTIAFWVVSTLTACGAHVDHETGFRGEFDPIADAAPEASHDAAQAPPRVLGCLNDPARLASWVRTDAAICSAMPGRVAFTNGHGVVCCVKREP